MPGKTTVPGLRRAAIGLREVLFQSIMALAPAMAVAAVATSVLSGGAAFAGGSLPLTGLLTALLTATGLPVFAFVSELTAPVSYAGPVVGAWLMAGVLVLIVLLPRNPGRIADTARVHLDETSTPVPWQSGAVQP